MNNITDMIAEGKGKRLYATETLTRRWSTIVMKLLPSMGSSAGASSARARSII